MKFFIMCIFLCAVKLSCSDIFDNPCTGEPWSVYIETTGYMNHRENFQNILTRIVNDFQSHIPDELNVKAYTSNDGDDLIGTLDYHRRQSPGRSERKITVIFDAGSFYKTNYNKILERNYFYAGPAFQLSKKENKNYAPVNKLSGKYYSQFCKEEIKRANDIRKEISDEIDDKVSSLIDKVKQIEIKTNYSITTRNAKQNSLQVKQMINLANNIAILKPSKSSLQIRCELANRMITEDPSQVIGDQEVAKIVSSNIVKHPALNELIQNYAYPSRLSSNVHHCTKTMAPLNIIICGIDNYWLLKIYYLFYDTLKYKMKDTLVLRHEVDCEKISIDPMTVAVIATKPFETPAEIRTTTIFYDTDYTIPAEEDITADKFLNSFYWVPQKRTMKALVEFIKHSNHDRVAVVTDDLQSSKEYEHDLVSLLEEDSFIYITKSCDVMNCDLTKVLQPLMKAQPKIIIANVEKGSLLENALPWQDLVLLFRSPSAAEGFAKLGSKVYVAKLEGKSYCENDNSYCNIQEVFGTILDYLREADVRHPGRIRAQTYMLEEIYRDEFTSGIKKRLYNKTVKAIIQEFHSNGAREAVAEMDISPNNQMKNYKSYIRAPIRNDLNCYFKSEFYMKPCYDVEFLYFILILPVFLLTLLTIIYFFNSGSTLPYTRMTN